MKTLPKSLHEYRVALFRCARKAGYEYHHPKTVEFVLAGMWEAEQISARTGKVPRPEDVVANVACQMWEVPKFLQD